jgi:hypothetical protein
MFKTFSAITTSKPFIDLSIGIICIVIIGIPLFFVASNNNSNKKIRIYPEINLNSELLKCLESSDALTATVAAPAMNQEFNESDTINYNGNVVFKCNDLIQDKSSLKYSYNWLLNGSESTSKETSGSLGAKPQGNYNLKFEVKLEVGKNKDLTTSNAVDIKVIKPQILGNTAPPAVIPVPQPNPTPTPPPPPVNNAPVVGIRSPKSGQTFTVNNSDKAGDFIVISFSGFGSDPDGDSITYTWDNGLGSGPTTSGKFYAPWCGNKSYNVTLIVTDSKGASAKASVNFIVYGYCVT